MSALQVPSTPTSKEICEHDINELQDSELMQLDLNPDLDDANDLNITDQSKLARRPQKRNEQACREDPGLFDDVHDFQPCVDLGSPFESQTNLIDLNNENTLEKRVSTRRLSLSQQSKFVSYIDEQLMQIQRKYVQSRGGLNIDQGYNSLSDILRDFKKLVDFIWYSIDGVSNTDSLLNQDLETTELFTKYENSKSTNFGQSDYLIKISDDILDYLDKFPITEQDEEDDYTGFKTASETTLDSVEANDRNAPGSLRKLFKLLKILDMIFARLIEGKVPGNFKLNGTETVRLIGIAERTRVMLPQLMEKNNLHGYHYEISRIYQETLERGT